MVLAGDHKQMGLKVYSAQARQLNFHLSIIERLTNYYKANVGDPVTVVSWSSLLYCAICIFIVIGTSLAIRVILQLVINSLSSMLQDNL